MKILTLIGTRPEIIRLSRIIPKLDGLVEHVVVHTGQNYDECLSEVFFRELALRAPDHALGARGTFAQQIGTILAGMEELLLAERPDRFLVLGDTNSSLAAIVAKRLGVPVYHMEAGNRCYDPRVPEEVNRRLIDHASDVLLPYTERARQNLLREGIESERVYVTGNPIYEVIQHYDTEISRSNVLEELELRPGKYFLATAHRQENVDVEERLRGMIVGLERLRRETGYPVVVSTHPRTQKRIREFGLDVERDGMRFLQPFGFFDFIALERSARCVLSDSGTVQEECSLLGVPNVTLRDATERPETRECGCNVLSGTEPESIALGVRAVLETPAAWSVPREYLTENVSDTVVRLLLGNHWT